MEQLIESKVLKELGLTQKNAWIIYDKAPNSFFEFLSKNFDERNILSEQENEKCKILKESNEMLSKEEVVEKLKLIEDSIPDVYEMSDSKIKEIETDLEFYLEILAETEGRCAKIQRQITSTQDDIDSIENKQFDLDHYEKKLTENCSNSIAKLGQIIENNQAKMKMINDIYSQSQQIPSVLMHSIIEDRDINKLKLIMSEIEKFIESCVEWRGHEDENKSNINIMEINKKIRDINSRFIADEVLLEAFYSIQNNIESFQIQDFHNICEFQQLVQMVQMETEKLEDYHNMLMTDVIGTTEKKQESKISTLFNTFFEAKNGKSLNTLNNVKNANCILESSVQLVELLWCALELEVKRLNDRVDNSQEIHDEAQAVNLRINLMKNFNNLNHSEITSDLIFGKIKQAFDQFESFSEINDLVSCLREIVKVQDEIEDSRRTCASGKHLSAIHEQLKLVESQRKQLADFIYNGATNCPMLIDSKFITKVYSEEQCLKYYEKVFNELKSQFKKNILDPWESDEIYKIEKNLWIYFMTEPSKFFTSIDKIKKKVAEHEVGQSTRRMSRMSKTTK